MVRSNFTMLVLSSLVAVAQQPPTGSRAAPKNYPGDHRPPQFFRESWKNPLVTDGKQEPGVRQDHLESPNLELKLYGPPNLDIRIVRHAAPLDDPSYIWSGSYAPQKWVRTG